MKTIHDIIQNDAFDHITEEIIFYLSIEDICNCRLVCHCLKEVIDGQESCLKQIRKFKARSHPILRNILSRIEKENNKLQGNRFRTRALATFLQDFSQEPLSLSFGKFGNVTMKYLEYLTLGKILDISFLKRKQGFARGLRNSFSLFVVSHFVIL